MKLFNSLSKQLEDFKPLDHNTVRLYSCGPTVYDHAHIGNLSAYIFADTLRRALQAAGYNVRHTMNYTDVDDKTIRRSHQQHPDLPPLQALQKLTNHYIQIFLADTAKIGNDTTAVQFVRATDPQTIRGMQQLISSLQAKGFAYLADDGVYFSIQAYIKSGKHYGQLTEVNTQNTSQARIQNDEYDKESIHDFALWKKQKAHEPAWPFKLDGQDLTGRPGWHIECSVMSRQSLGQPFDIHTGGIDILFPHHENEIAQSTALESDPRLAQFFCHNEHILVNGQKMAKSAHNFYTLDDVIQHQFDPLAFRLLVLQSHYRKPTNFSWDLLEAAQKRLQTYRAMADLQFQPSATDNWVHHDTHTTAIKNALADDLNTPQALMHLSALAAQADDKLVSHDDLDNFRHLLKQLDNWLGLGLLQREDITAKQKQLLNQRQAARQQKDWAAADKLRQQLLADGLVIRDTAAGQIWGRS